MAVELLELTAIQKQAYEEFAKTRYSGKIDWAPYLEHLLPVAYQAALRHDGMDSIGHKVDAAGVDCLIGPLGGHPEVLLVAAALLRPKRLAVITTKQMMQGYRHLRELVDSKEFRTLVNGAIPAMDDDPHLFDRERFDLEGMYQAVYNEFVHSRSSVKNARQGAFAVLITGGTNEMVAALSACAFAVPGIDTFYLEGHAPRNAPTDPTSQRLLRVTNPLEVFGGIDRAKADHAFRSGNYAEARDTYRRLAKATLTVADAVLASTCDLYERAQCYDYTKAKPFSSPGSSAEIQDHFKAMSRVLLSLRKPNWIAAAAWLDGTAEQQFRAGQYVQSAATAYRALESICQIQCRKRFGWPAKKRSADILYENKDLYLRGEALKRKELPRHREVRFQATIGLVDRWTFLRAERDPIGQLYDLDQIEMVVNVRNASLFGHEFIPPTKGACRNLLDAVQAAASALEPSLATEYKQCLEALAIKTPGQLRKLQTAHDGKARGSRGRRHGRR